MIYGVSQGIGADLARGGLKFLSLFYEAAIRTRNVGFDTGLLRTHRAAVPVVSVGNLTAGGTGKTPMVAAVADWFTARGIQPVILSRGYRAVETGANDEKRVLDQLCPTVPHLQNANRFESAQRACRDHGAHVLILDDGFQHRRLARDLDIVLLDALDPWGTGRLLPRGLLREPLNSLRRADLIVLTRADLCSSQEKRRILERVTAWAPTTALAEVTFAPADLLSASGSRTPIDSMSSQPVAAFCGIGNPEGFKRTFLAAGFGVDTDAFRVFPDHHHYSAADLDDLAAWAARSGARALITTQKDLVKIPRLSLNARPLWALTIRARFLAGQEQFESALQRVMADRTLTSNSFQ